MLFEFTCEVLRRGVIQTGSDLLDGQTSPQKHTVSHLHFGIEKILNGRTIQIFAELPVQCRPGTLGTLHDLFKRDRFLQIFVDEFDRFLKPRRTGIGEILRGDLQQQPVTLAAGIPEILVTADLAQFDDPVHYPGNPGRIIGLQHRDPVKFQIFQRLGQQSSGDEHDLFGGDFRFTAHGTVQTELNKEDLSWIDLITFAIQSVIENAVNDHFNAEGVRVDPFPENLTVPLVDPAAGDGDRTMGAHLSK